MLRDQVEITRLAEICEKSPAIAKLIEASVTSEGRVALEAARAKLRQRASTEGQEVSLAPCQRVTQLILK